MPLPISIRNLISHFSQLPGLGQKTSERLVFYLLKQDKNFLLSFAENLLHIKDKIKNCALCGSLTEHLSAVVLHSETKAGNLCSICSDSKRDHSVICIVAEIQDIQSLEKSREFNGVYHVLNGALSPTEGINPENLRIKELLERINHNQIKEIILALNPTIEGETTVLYLTKLLKRYNIKITKLARGLPQGSDLEYADEVTLANAIKGRTII